MAKLIPQRSSCLSGMTPGEKRFSERLEQKLDDDYLCWFDVPIGPCQRRPDFIVVHPSRGVLVLEVKDWRIETLVDLDSSHAVISTDQGHKRTANPLRQARECAIEINSLLQIDPQLRHPEGATRQGQTLVTWAFGAVLSMITRAQFEAARLGTWIPEQMVICRDEMTESADSEVFQKRLWDMFSVHFRCSLTLSQIDRIRWHLFPELRIRPPVQESLFRAAGQPLDEPLIVPDLMRIMDLQQEQLARSLGDGHRVIHGVAGSGKTMILGYRSVELAKRYTKPVLVLCYNKALANRLAQQLAVHGMEGHIIVRNFHGWCLDQLGAFGVARPSFNSDPQTWLREMVETVCTGMERKTIPCAQYSAILIDEGHDFEPEWLKLVTRMIDPDSNSLLLLYDDAQTIYGGGRKKFSFASVGIQAKGRTTILRLNYRNTLEVLSTARIFANELLAAQEADDDHVPIIAPESAGRRGSIPEIVFASNIWDETRIVAQRIKGAIADGSCPNEFGVLCRTKAAGELFSRQLVRSGLPVRLMTDTSNRAGFAAEPAITVMTMHSSKGLEFESVFLPSLCDVAARRDLSGDDLLQEARLVYVAMTRALNRLTMLHHCQTPITERLSAAVDEVRQRLAA